MVYMFICFTYKFCILFMHRVYHLHLCMLVIRCIVNWLCLCLLYTYPVLFFSAHTYVKLISV